MSQRQKCETFKRLHNADSAFLMPNPWDVGSAKLLQGMGFAALATTSSGFAFSKGNDDGSVTLAEKLKHCHEMSDATDLPINADFEDGFARSLEQLAENVRAVIQTGIAGFSIEDFSREEKVLYSKAEAIERIRVARETIDGTGIPVMLTARAENLIRGVCDLDDTIDRLIAFEKAGADVLYAPGLSNLADLALVTGQISKPFNVLASRITSASRKDLEKAGATRISIGGAMTWASLKPVIDAGREMLEQGTFTWIDDIASPQVIRSFME